MNVIRVSSLIATDVLLVAVLVFLLAGCVSTPQQHRNGDFVSHMASVDVNARAPAPLASVGTRRA